MKNNLLLPILPLDRVTHYILIYKGLISLFETMSLPPIIDVFKIAAFEFQDIYLVFVLTIFLLYAS